MKNKIYLLLIFILFTECTEDEYFNIKANLIGTWNIHENINIFKDQEFYSNTKNIIKANFLKGGIVYLEKGMVIDTATWIYSERKNTMHIIYDTDPTIIRSYTFQVEKAIENNQIWRFELLYSDPNGQWKYNTEWELKK